MAASFDWCGFFAMENYLQSNLDSDLKRGFFHVTNVEHYFTYRYAFGERDDTRVMKWIYAEDSWHELQAYHTARGSLRTWLNAARDRGRRRARHPRRRRRPDRPLRHGSPPTTS